MTSENKAEVKAGVFNMFGSGQVTELQRETNIRVVAEIAATVLNAASKDKQKWLHKVLKQLGTPEAKKVREQLEAWTPEQWRSPSLR
jgi:hypothetical protein